MKTAQSSTQSKNNKKYVYFLNRIAPLSQNRYAIYTSGGSLEIGKQVLFSEGICKENGDMELLEEVTTITLLHAGITLSLVEVASHPNETFAFV